MAEQIGEFSLKHAGNTYAKAEDGEIARFINFDGTATGFGAVFGTLCIKTPFSELAATSGSCTWIAQAYPDDKTTLGGVGEGTWEQVEGDHKWKIVVDVDITNGDKHHSEGEIDLQTLMFTGKIYSVD